MRTQLMHERNIQYGTGGGIPLMLDVLRPEDAGNGSRPAIIWVHGGGWRGGERDPNPNSRLAEFGFVTFTISYRFSQQAVFPAQIHDVKAAIRFVRANAERFTVDPGRIGIWGHSAGGHLAALAGVSADHPELDGDSGTPDVSSAVQAVAPMSAPTDFGFDWYERAGLPVHEDGLTAVTQLFGGPVEVHPALAQIASPVTFVTADAPPFLIVHGAIDDLVPVHQAQSLTKALREAGVSVTSIELPGIGHDFHQVLELEDQPSGSVWKQITGFFANALELNAAPAVRL